MIVGWHKIPQIDGIEATPSGRFSEFEINRDTAPFGMTCSRLDPVFRAIRSSSNVQEQILNSRDLSKKGPLLRRLAYAMRTASKAIALSAQ